jgi:hypothetical protein
MLLFEEMIESDSGEFTVTADTPELAAAILFNAHDRSREECTSWVRLPDGQKQHIEPDNVIKTRVFCVLLNEAGEEVTEVEPDFSKAPETEPDYIDQDQSS